MVRIKILARKPLRASCAVAWFPSTLRQADFHGHHVRVRPPRLRHRLGTVASLADHPQVPG